MEQKLVIGAKHPDIGMLYWYVVDESSVNAPNFYGITNDIAKAIDSPEIRYLMKTARVSRGWFLEAIVRCNVEGGREPVDNLGNTGRRLSWPLARYADKAGTHSDFLNWMYEADWTEILVSAEVSA